MLRVKYYNITVPAVRIKRFSSKLKSSFRHYLTYPHSTKINMYFFLIRKTLSVSAIVSCGISAINFVNNST